MTRPTDKNKELIKETIDSSEKVVKPGEKSPKINNPLPLDPEFGGPKGPEPTRFGDWETKGRCSDF